MDSQHSYRAWTAGAQNNQLGANDSNGGGTGGETHWNADDDLTLSYFLSGELGENNNNHCLNSTSSETQVAKQSVGDNYLTTLNQNCIEPPSTPAVQFYASNSLSRRQKPNRSQSSPALASNCMQDGLHQQRPSQNGIEHGSQPGFSPLFNQPYASATALSSYVASSSSSSSLSSMQAPPRHQKLAHQHYKPNLTAPTMVDKSTSSPATIVGAGEEMMMLPPPSLLPTTSHTSTLQHSKTPVQPIPRQQVSHLEWLQRMNQAAALSTFQFPSSHNSSQNSIAQNALSTQDSCAKQPRSHLSSTSSPLTPTNGTSTSKQQQTFISTMPMAGTTSNADILPSLPSNGNTTRQCLFFPHTKEAASSEPTVAETKERRQRRLARNRESARQSRRRKKQLLSDLGVRVNKLHTHIETERKKQLVVMEKDLDQDRKRIIRELFCCERSTGDERVTESMLKSRIQALIQDGGPNSSARRNAAAFQYDSLRQLILPFHKQYFLWLSLQDESFFTTAKEKRSKTGKGTGRVSSKHVGDELSAAHRTAARINTGCNAKTGIACSADDTHRAWPLICYELGVSLDQEEKLLNAFRRVKHADEIRRSRTKLSIATTMVTSLKNGVLYQSHSASQRNETALLRILNPSQTAQFQQWLLTNKSRCIKLFDVKNTKIEEQNTGLNIASNFYSGDNSRNDASLSCVCEQLTEALKITRKG